MTIEELQPDPPLTPDQVDLASRLTAVQLEAIDRTLLAYADCQWRKLAFIVGTAMGEPACKVAALPDVFFSQRIQALVANGMLEARGNLAFMRFSEVRRLAAPASGCT